MASGTLSDCPPDLLAQIQRLEELFAVPTDLLHKITNHFISELEKGLSVEGGNIVRIPSRCPFSDAC
jgi:hexokinase